MCIRDRILVDTQKPHMQPLYHPVSQLVYAAKGSDVRSVWIKGRQIMEERQILTMEVEEVIRKARELAKGLSGART
jgi:5-methylthioadenosine/S-adenosylhomocysteine deaminase